MRDTKGCEVVGVVEDARQLSFADRVLRKLGFSGRNIYLEAAPKGRGSANSRVLKEYVPLVHTFRKRRKSARPNSGVFVMIDADQYTVEQRTRQLDEGLAANQLDPRTSGESIAIWVPKRHIETWLVHLCGGTVTEEEDVKRQRRTGDEARAATEFVRLFHEQKQRSVDTLPSIASALEETFHIRD